MRLHHLSMTAFGPFAGSEHIDFDELCEAGLFLLTGPTGAGKTTILDAVCFALYGSVPGVRGVKALKSQHAPPDRRPEVVLDFSVRDRRFVVRRSPEWSRPKRRGDGLTTENARATLLEVVQGEEQLLSSRAQEVGHFIGELVGMQSTQFVQVAMLPQGEFQKFLRASSQDRHDVLQHLFRTDRYARIEEWVHDHSRSLREHSVAGQSAVVRALDGLADRAGQEVPEELTGDALTSESAAERARSWADDLLAAADVAASAAADLHVATQEACDTARRRHDDGVRVHELVARRDQARATLAELAADAEAELTARARLEADDRAARCVPLLRMLDEAVGHARQAEATWTRQSERLTNLDLGPLALPEPVTADALARLEHAARSRAGALEALLPREEALRVASARLADDEEALAAARDRLGRASEQRDALPEALARVQQQVREAAAGAGRLEALTVELGQAREQAAAARQAEECEEALVRLRDAERDARDRAADAREQVQALTARRLAGMAAELAGHLEPGEACQVCGSTEHPQPATASSDAVSEVEQAAAEEAHQAATADYVAASSAVVQMRERLDGLRAAAGGRDAQGAAGRVSELEQASDEARRAQVRLAEETSRVEQLQKEQDRLAVDVQELATQVATLEQSVAASRGTITQLRAELSDALGEAAVGPLTDEIGRMGRLAATLDRVRGALSEHESAAARVADLEARVTAAAREHRFAGIAELRDAALSADERLRLTDLVQERSRAGDRARSVLDEEAISRLADEPAPDLGPLQCELKAAEEAASAAARQRHTHEEAREALGRHAARLEQALAEWGPVRERYLRADAMARLVRGTGADNQLQMRLSAYVLATRLDQVVAAANERLAHMRDQRYLLQRTGRATRRGAQAGLGLEVVDQWTGHVRDPSTLSGGETFVVSLALALGLADVVTQEAGGTEIETLFVDEGFGSLDPDTLDDVMDRLDDLRSGGRAVGVVSHVSELRNRIPTQLHVDKGRTGSVVAVRTAVG